MIKAKILWIDKRDGNGIAKTDDGSEYYFDVSVFKDFQKANRGDLVAFKHNESIKGCLCARNLTLVKNSTDGVSK